MSEREIVMRLYESRINENFPPILKNLSRYDLNIVRNYIVKNMGIDIQNTPVTTTTVTSNRDAQLRDANTVLILHVKSWSNKIIPVVVAGGKVISNNDGGASWKDLLAKTVAIEKLVKGDGSELADKRKSRSIAKSGMIVRNKSKAGTGRYDKSGYELNPNKYKDMLAKLKLSSVQGVLDKAYKLFNKMASSLDTDISHSKSRDYDDIMRGMLRYFRDLKDYNDAYEKDKKAHPEYDDDYNYLRRDVINSIEHLQEYVRDAERFLKNLKESKSLKESSFREFSKSDSYGYAGAMKLPSGKNPLIASLDVGDIGMDIIISGLDKKADGAMIEINVVDGKDDSSAYSRFYNSEDEAVADGRRVYQYLKSMKDESKILPYLQRKFKKSR